MISKIKALGLAVFAMMAISAFAASAAQATLGQLHIDTTKQTAILTGQIDPGQKSTLKIGGINTECEEANLEGTLTKTEGTAEQITVQEATLTPTYGNCQSSFGGGLVFLMNGCKFTITGGVAELTAQADVVGCTTGKHIEWRIPSIGCTMTIAEQNGLSHIVFDNQNPGAGKEDETQTKDLTATATVTGIAFTRNGALCPNGQAGFTANTTIQAFEDTATQQQLTDMEHQFTRHICGTQVGVFAT